MSLPSKAFNLSFLYYGRLNVKLQCQNITLKLWETIRLCVEFYTTLRFHHSSPYCSHYNCVIVKQQYQYITCTGNLVYFPLSVKSAWPHNPKYTTLYWDHTCWTRVFSPFERLTKTVKYCSVCILGEYDQVFRFGCLLLPVVLWIHARRLKVTRIV